MKVTCPNCHKSFVVGGLGRRRLNLPGNKVLASLLANGSITLTAKEYGVSRGTIRNVIKASAANYKKRDSKNAR
jgi:transposase-like protein